MVLDYLWSNLRCFDSPRKLEWLIIWNTRHQTTRGERIIQSLSFKIRSCLKDQVRMEILLMGRPSSYLGHEQMKPVISRSLVASSAYIQKAPSASYLIFVNRRCILSVQKAHCYVSLIYSICLLKIIIEQIKQEHKRCMCCHFIS
jgi:hypothetical protein